MVQDPFMEDRQLVEFSWGEQVQENTTDVRDVAGRRLLDGGAANREQADHRAAGVGGGGLAADQPTFLHASKLVGETALLPTQGVAQLMGSHAVPLLIPEHPPAPLSPPAPTPFLHPPL